MGPWMMRGYDGSAGGGWTDQWGMMGTGGFWIWGILSLATWILIVVALIAFIRWMWKKGDKK